MVRAEGLEPPQLSSLEPKPSASTNSATPAIPKRSIHPTISYTIKLRLIRIDPSGRGSITRSKKDASKKAAPPEFYPFISDEIVRKSIERSHFLVLKADHGPKGPDQ